MTLTVVGPCGAAAQDFDISASERQTKAVLILLKKSKCVAVEQRLAMPLAVAQNPILLDADEIRGVYGFSNPADRVIVPREQGKVITLRKRG